MSEVVSSVTSAAPYISAAIKNLGYLSLKFIESAVGAAYTIDIDTSFDGINWGASSVTQVSVSATSAITFNNLDVDLATDEITATAHGLKPGTPVLYLENTGLIDELTDGTTYYVIVVDANTIQLATSYANAIAGTAIDLVTKNGNDGYTIQEYVSTVITTSDFGGYDSSTYYRARLTVSSGTLAGTILWNNRSR